MSGITTLTAKMKAAAKEEIMCREACDTSDLWQDEASPENVLALVEALEAAEKRIAESVVLFETLGQRIAELEARTLTVKLPKTRRVKLVSGEVVHGWTAYEMTSAITNAGIKLQIEGSE